MEITLIRPSPADPDGPVEIHLTGSIDLDSRHQLLDAAATAFLVSRTLNVDATGVDFIDSVGIGTLVEITRMAKSEGATFDLTGRSPHVQRALDLVGLGTVWP